MIKSNQPLLRFIEQQVAIKQDLAEYLGITLRSLNRALRDLGKEQ